MDWLSKIPIAHRGLHAENIDENSLESFQAAIDEGYAIELDLKLSKDGEIIVIHDNSLRRLCGSSAKVSELDREALRAYSLPRGSKIPTLPEALALVDGQTPLLIEIKTFSRAHKLEQRLIPMLDAYQGEFAIQSFDPFSCRYVKSMRPEWCVGLLDVGLGVGPAWLRRAVDRSLFGFFPPDFINYRYQGLLPGMLDSYRERGTTVLAYGLAETELLGKHYLDRADNIVFDRAPLVRRGERRS